MSQNFSSAAVVIGALRVKWIILILLLIFSLFAVFDVLSQFAMLYMLLSLSLGWTLGTSYKNTHLQMIIKKPASKVVGLLALLQVSSCCNVIYAAKSESRLDSWYIL